MFRPFFLIAFLIAGLSSFGQYKKRSLEKFIHSMENEGYFVSYDPDAIVYQVLEIPKKISSSEANYWIEISSKNQWEFIVAVDSSVFVRKKPGAIEDFHCFVVRDSDTWSNIGNFTYNERGSIKTGTSYGYFSLFGNVPDSVSVYHQDYGEQSFVIKEQAGCQVLNMSFMAIDLDPVDISVYMMKGIEEDVNEHVIIINPEQLVLVPGQEQGDVLQALNLLPGFNSASGNLGSMSVRGSTPDQNLLLVDDIPISYRGHVFGSLSPFQTDLISSISVSRDGGGIEEVDKLGGQINMKIIEEDLDSVSQYFRANSTLASYAIKGPLKSDKIKFALGVRSSYPIGWTSPRMEAAQNVGYFGGKMTIASIIDSIDLLSSGTYFSDVSAKVLFDIRELYSLEVSAVGYLSKLGFNITDYNVDENVEMDRSYKNNGLKVKLNKERHKGFEWNLLSTYSHYSFYQYEISTSFSGTESILINQSGLHDVRIRFTNSYRINKNQLLSSGVMIDYLQSSESTPDRSTGEVEKNQSNGLVHSGFVKYECQVFKDTRIEAGMKLNSMSANTSIRFLPRLKIVSGLFENMKFNLSISSLNQYLFQPISFDFNDSGPENHLWLISQNEESVQKAQVLSAGLSWRSKMFQIELEGYYKGVNGLAYSSQEPGETVIIPGSNRVGGIDFVASYNHENRSVWLKYSYSSIKWSLDNIGDIFSAYYEQPHSLNVGGALRLSKCTFSAGWSVKSGVPNQEINIEGIVRTPGPMGGIIRVDPFVRDLGRFSVFHQLDVSVSRQLKFKRGRILSYGASVLNLYDRQNGIEVFQPGGRGPSSVRYTTRISPDIFIKMSF
jgi:hypothetical protein